MKNIFAIAIGLLICSSASAQQFFGSRADYDRTFERRIGFTLGAAFANTATHSQINSNFNTGTLTGFNIGFTLDLPVTSLISFTPEILYSQRGYTANTQSGNFSQRSQYIDLPLLVKFRTGSPLNFYAGPQVSYLMSSTNNYSNGFIETNRDYYKYGSVRTFFSGVIGAGLDINRSVDLHARYAIDLKGTNMNGNTYVPAYRNQALQIGLGLKF